MAASDTISYGDERPMASYECEKPASSGEAGFRFRSMNGGIPTIGIPHVAPSLYRNRQIHIRVNGTCDLKRPRLIEGDSLRVARIDRETGVSQLRRRISIGNALAIVASANDVKAAS